MKATLSCNDECSSLLNSEPEVAGFIDELVEFLSLMPGNFQKGSNSSFSLRRGLGEHLGSWNTDLLIQRDFPARKFPSSHVHVDFQTEISSSQGNQKTQITLELFADNRQAIASNLLKLELAGKNFKHIGNALGIGITLGKDLKKQGWDGATASSEEYEFALFHTYASFIKMPLALISLDQAD
jgi:hypothetical protein